MDSGCPAGVRVCKHNCAHAQVDVGTRARERSGVRDVRSVWDTPGVRHKDDKETTGSTRLHTDETQCER
ncbi:hypothetical protein T265_11501 [Opisthorchis viverrini]|uniref:Uncharacterized protein n=1 Tax=Opisthorchis viverrini TaxID=6198 RepID=A0A074Z999_OPIVI|nr:hypothetical protein T265_11501 [Opisthorchis viverrini]KER19820.1 hypothetical protein T265_11501 [Opisthorchis viverrini]